MKLYRNVALAAPPGLAATTFTLAQAGPVSAGFLHKTTGALARTLYNHVPMAAGTYPMPTWPADGLSDEGTPLVKADYAPVVVSSQMEYTWLRPLFNTSNINGGPKVWHNFEVIQGGCVIGSRVRCWSGYNEHNSAVSMFDVDRPNERIGVLEHIHFGMQILHGCTDGAIIYLAGSDVALGGHTTDDTFVIGLKDSDNSQQIFSSGQRFVLASNHVYDSIICYLRSPLAMPTGIAVQRPASGFLFVARGGMDTVHVYNKTDYTLVQTLTGYPNARRMDMDANGDLWITTGVNTVRRYTINANGTLTATSTVLPGLTAPGYVFSNPSGTRITVLDVGDQHVAKHYSLTGVAQGVHGEVGGYANTALISNYRYMLRNPIRPAYTCWGVYQTDGKMWLGDPGSYRNLRFNADGTYDNQVIMYMPHSRSMGVDKVKPTHVYCEYLRGTYNYDTGLLVPTHNYLFNFRQAQDSEYHRLKWVMTYSNGRTYAWMPAANTYGWEIVELTDAGIRWTGKIISRKVSGSDRTNNVILLANGRLRTFTDFYVGGVHQYADSDLPTFDGAGNPSWANFQVAGETPITTDRMGLFRPYIDWNSPPREDPANGLLIGFEGGSSSPEYASKYWHISGLPRGASAANGTNAFSFQAAPRTDTRTMSDFPYPTDGSYPMGGGVQYPGGTIMCAGNSIFWGYHGEFRYDRQDNKYTHVDATTGLVVGIFGIAGHDNINGVSPWDSQPYPGLAGNNVKAEIIERGGYYYIFHCDEGHHGAVHVWRISGAGTIKQHRFTTPALTATFNATTRNVEVAGITSDAATQIEYAIIPS